MNKIVKNALVLMAFSLVLGFVLGAVYKITEPIIAEAARQKEMEAYKVVFENADEFVEVAVDVAAAEKLMADGGYPDTINKAFQAVDASGNSLGYVVQLTTKDGYSGGIVMVVGITNEGIVNGYSVTSHSETSGLGTKAFDPAYVQNYTGISVDSVSDVATISGATLTSTAVKNAVNAAVAYANSLGGA